MQYSLSPWKKMLILVFLQSKNLEQQVRDGDDKFVAPHLNPLPRGGDKRVKHLPQGMG